jgi:hypothetical protein
MVFEGPLAQLVEQLTLNQLVVGSIPTRPTNLLKNNKFFDVARKKLKSFPLRSELPPFDWQKLFFSFFSSAKGANHAA